jgi:hypothetical protein
MNLRAILFVIAVVILLTLWDGFNITEQDAKRITDSVSDWIRGG